jgi:hypothetical protein
MTDNKKDKQHILCQTLKEERNETDIIDCLLHPERRGRQNNVYNTCGQLPALHAGV